MSSVTNPRSSAVKKIATTSSETIVGIHYVRGLAAFIVLIHHASAYLMILRDYGEIHKFIPFFGRYGVELFFAISGYLMATILPRQNAFDFLMRRVLRIYPMFLLVAAIVLMQPLWPRPLNLPSLLLAPIGKPSASTLGVEWTLVLEVGFYVVLFSVTILGMKHYIKTLALAWLTVLLLYAFTIGEFGPQSTTIVNFLLAPANIAFAIGLLLPSILKYKNASVVLLLIGLALMVLTHLVPVSTVRAVVAISAACLVGWTTSLRPLPAIIDAILHKLGDWSYSLYLCHVPVIVICYNSMPSASIPTLFFTAIIVALAVTAFIGPIETRLHEFSRIATKRLTITAKAALSVSFAIAYVGVGIYYL